MELIYKCEIIRNFGGSPCHASGLKQCQNCKKIMKSNCSKQKCFVDVAKPAMVPVVFDHRLLNYPDVQSQKLGKLA